MANITLINTTLTRRIAFDQIERMGVDISRPIMQTKTCRILGYKITGSRKTKTRGSNVETSSRGAP